MKYLNTSCHHLFIDKGTHEKFKGGAEAINNFQEFARSSVKLTQENENTQEYLFNHGSSVKSEFEAYMDDPNHWDVFSERLAASLLGEQQESQKNLDRFKRKVKVTPGSLLLIHCKPSDNDVETLVLIKMEQEEVANVEDFEHLFGLPTEKKALNTALVTFEKGKEPALWVSRANAYWIKFLDVSPIRSSSVNTSNAFDAIDGQLNKFKKDFKADHLLVRNHLLTYLRNHDGDTISYQDIIETVVLAHKPVDSKFKPNEWAKRLLELPKKTKKTFDKQFEVDMSSVKAKRKSVISLTDKIDLNLKDGIENINEVIEPFDDRSGRKGIIIYSEQGYEHFMKNTEE
ncbi:hypothetical protein [Vibrio sonorensis]|uniref:hypothetical protein n=1 Tax=Vibrio sonorensis TaxID=1004316 RepID=UPI0008D9F751|nr:hypothetical protein [Vibrio sonorensis]